VVDDFPNTRKVIEYALSKIGEVEFLHANDGKEALEYFDDRKVDLLITDYNMPNMNGAELAKAVRSIKEYEFIPILMLTTEKDENKKLSAKEAGITAWIKKPFVTEEFISIVKRCMN